MKVARVFLFGWALALSLSVLAQYQWIDKDGRRVFSDRAPPADIPQKNILKEPRGAATASARMPTPAATEGPQTGADSASVAAAPSPAASAPKATGVDKALEDKKKQADAAEQAKKKAEESKVAAAHAENCQRAKTAKTSLESGVRIARANDKGEREFLDDAQRAAELKRVNATIASECK